MAIAAIQGNSITVAIDRISLGNGQCGAAVKPDDRFCSSCGHRLG